MVEALKAAQEIQREEYNCTKKETTQLRSKVKSNTFKLSSFDRNLESSLKEREILERLSSEMPAANLGGMKEAAVGHPSATVVVSLKSGIGGDQNCGPEAATQRQMEEGQRSHLSISAKNYDRDSVNEFHGSDVNCHDKVPPASRSIQHDECSRTKKEAAQRSNTQPAPFKRQRSRSLVSRKTGL
jgi:hypothetical protein